MYHLRYTNLNENPFDHTGHQWQSFGQAAGSISYGYVLDGNRATGEVSPFHLHGDEGTKQGYDPWYRDDTVGSARRVTGIPAMCGLHSFG